MYKSQINVSGSRLYKTQLCIIDLLLTERLNSAGNTFKIRWQGVCIWGLNPGDAEAASRGHSENIHPVPGKREMQGHSKPLV